MYFVQLRNLKEYDKNLLKRFDQVLKSLHSSSRFFTPEFIRKYLNLDIDDSYNLLFRARDIGIVYTVEGVKCTNCGSIYKNNTLGQCPKCHSQNSKAGYYFTTNSYQRVMQ